MTEPHIEEIWATLEPTADQRRRVEARVSAWLEARETTLAAEWLGLFRLQPLAAFGLVAVSGVSVAATPPVLWFVLAALR
jgi:hypothetical protein